MKNSKPGRPMQAVVLTEVERDKLLAWSRRPKTQQRLALRAKIVLEAAVGKSNSEIARLLKITLPTVGKWRSRFLQDRLEGLVDEPRPGAPRTLSDAKVEDLITQTLEQKPPAATHWSTRSMAQRLGLSQSSVSRVWRAFGLKPHLTKTFKLSTDPFFVEKVKDVVGLYLNPPDRAIVLSIDEKSQVQALDRTQPLLPLLPGQAERGTYDYERHGTTSLFAALNVATGEVVGKCYKKHRQQEFLRFLDLVDAALDKVPGMQVHVILDNYSTHKTPRVKQWFLKHSEYHIHFTPTSGSWLNQVERFFGELTEKRLRRGVFRNVKSLEEAIEKYLQHHNANAKPFVWTANADKILQRVANICKRISDSGH